MVDIGAKVVAESIEALASAARTATSAGEAAVRMPPAAAYLFVLDVTAAADETADTLDVYIQTKIGENWFDAVHFTQVLGDGGAVRHVAKVLAGAEQAMYEVGTALAAGSVRHLCGDQWRVRYAIADSGDADASFTFSVDAVPL